MAQHHVHVHYHSTRPLAQCFDLLADHNRLGPILGAEVRRIHDGTGVGGVNGVGSVRTLTIAKLVCFDETVTGVRPNERIDYRISRGAYPIVNHSGHVDFAGDEKGCTIDWSIDFDSKLPLAGTLIAAVLKAGISHGLRGHL
ncbi:MAG TPA: SRPBCC family protein [Nevskiaceae bacterium]|nr:SRPBCC family protein [Nevskiaceae bacterium]